MSETDKATFDSVAKVIHSEDLQAPFDELFSLHYRAVFRTASAIVHDSTLAEDVTQEVFLRLYRNLDEISLGERLQAWLLRVTINVARNTLRQPTSLDKSHLDAAKRESGFEQDMERRLAIEEARRALDKIKEPMRSCLLLKQQGLSYREIATTLSIKETSVNSLVARARKEFASKYGKIGIGRSESPKRKIKSDKNPVSLLSDSEITQVVPEEASAEVPNNEIKTTIEAFKTAIDKSVENMREDHVEIIRLRAETRNLIDRLETIY
jgi:RNA polymerase sigma factor (sigma-70 family)